MSIFKKKGTVESLFRMGADAAPSAQQADGDDAGTGKHEVYYVRGRPFIAPTKAGARTEHRRP